MLYGHKESDWQTCKQNIIPQQTKITENELGIQDIKREHLNKLKKNQITITTIKNTITTHKKSDQSSSNSLSSLSIFIEVNFTAEKLIRGSKTSLPNEFSGSCLEEIIAGAPLVVLSDDSFLM